jgi:hypothetical protein
MPTVNVVALYAPPNDLHPLNSDFYIMKNI